MVFNHSLQHLPASEVTLGRLAWRWLATTIQLRPVLAETRAASPQGRRTSVPLQERKKVKLFVLPQPPWGLQEGTKLGVNAST